MMLYALGALEMFSILYDINEIKMVIFQSRAVVSAVRAAGKDTYSEPKILGITEMTKLLRGYRFWSANKRNIDSC